LVDSALNDATLQPATEISTEPDAEALDEPDADTEPEVDNATDPDTTTIDEVTPGPNLGDIAEQEDNQIDDVTETTRNTYETNTNDNEAKAEPEIAESIANNTDNSNNDEVSVESKLVNHDKKEPEQPTLIRRSKRIINNPNPTINPDDIGDNDDPNDVDFA